MYRVSYQGVWFPIRRAETIIGRSTYCTIVIPSAAVSREHARLLLGADGLELTDLGSSNGTTVNGVLLTSPTAVRPGDVIGLGSERLLLSLGQLGASGRTERFQAIKRDEDEDEDEEATTKSQIAPSIELVERMAANAAGMPDPRVVATEVRRAIDWLAQDKAFQGIRGGKIRLMAAAEIVASWSRDGELDEWRRAVAARLGFGGS